MWPEVEMSLQKLKGAKSSPGHFARKHTRFLSVTYFFIIKYGCFSLRLYGKTPITISKLVTNEISLNAVIMFITLAVDVVN